MGQQYSGQVMQEMGVYPDSGVQRYVSSLGKELAAGTERPKLPWTFTVIDDPTVNAFALPGGYIFVTRGILTHMNSEAELASVVGHEIGHVTARHSVQQMTRQQLAQLGMVAGAIASDKIAQNLGVISQGLGVLFLKYSRDDESQADGLGFRYALNDGYDVRKMIDMFQILQRVTASAGATDSRVAIHSPRPGQPHRRRPRQRLARVTVPLDDKKVNREPFLRSLAGMVYGDNPRQGYFKGTSFLHPDLQFQLDFPTGWKTANQTQAVVGLSPAQDAQLQLSLAGQRHAGANPAAVSRAGRRTGGAVESDDHQRQSCGACPLRRAEPGRDQALGTGGICFLWGKHVSAARRDGRSVQRLRTHLPAVHRQFSPANRSGGPRGQARIGSLS